MIDLKERTKLMVEAYGECTTKAQACRILSRSRCCVDAMLADGRLEAACEGKMVDVRSIAKYISSPKQEDEEARKRRLKLRSRGRFAV